MTAFGETLPLPKSDPREKHFANGMEKDGRSTSVFVVAAKIFGVLLAAAIAVAAAFYVALFTKKWKKKRGKGYELTSA